MNIPNKYSDNEIMQAISYRTPMQVTKILVLKNDWSYPVCPRCNITIEREYMHYCDRCGQALDWKHFNKAQVIYKK